MKFKYLPIYIIYLSISLFNVAYAQNAETQKQKFAENYENSGDMTNAARIWEELYAANPTSEKNFSGLVRTFKALNRFSELMPVVLQKLETRKTPDMWALHGELLWRLGKAAEAQASWDKALSGKPDSPEPYNTVANTQISLRLFDKAIATLEKGREILQMPNLFGEQLCNLFIAAGDFQKGLAEILSLLMINQNLALAQGRVFALIAGEEASLYIAARLKSEADTQQNNILIQQLFAWLLRTTGKLNEAFDVYKRIDALYNANGREILNFAELSRSDGNYDIAIKGYENIIERGKANPYVSTALFGYARTLEMKSQAGNLLSESDAKRIIKLYESVIKDFPKTHIAYESQYRIADIAFAHLGDESRAIEELTSLIANFSHNQLSAAANLLIGNIYLQTGKIDLARTQYQKTASFYRQIVPDVGEKALFKLAELEYFLGEIDSAKAHFYMLSENKSSLVAADAINKIVHLEQNKDFEKGLRLFAKAEFMENRKEKEEAVKLYLETAESAAGSDLAEKSILNAAKIKNTLGESIEAIKLYNSILEKNPDTIYADLISLALGNIYINSGKKEEALNCFTIILTKYPRSIYLQEARQKIRQLRNETM